ncbi:MAG: Glu-tRNA(Gln) amidotransferase subunit GatE [Nanoarchaeota archaeon]
MALDYAKLGLKSGIEIHQQLSSHKLFCDCDSQMAQQSNDEIVRKMRAVAGELGDVDAAALHEVLQNKEFHYMTYPEETCLVETDSEPPHEMNRDALEIGLKIALMLNCEIPDEIHVMRKQVVDGSNTSGFQRTAIIGMNGWIKTSFGKVGITNISVEEDACQIIEKNNKKVVYGLHRLGIPLVEIGTSPDMRLPEQVKEASEKLGMILRSTGRVRRGLGTIRQDVNVSIKNGTRIELKGVQDLDMIPKHVDDEIIRQQGFIKKKESVPKEVRRVTDNGSEFMRPLTGGARMYPETDIPPISIDRNYLSQLKKELPELWDAREKRFMKQYGLAKDTVKQLNRMDKAYIFEDIVKKGHDAKLVANTLTAGLTQLKRKENINIENLHEKQFEIVFDAFKSGKLIKDAILTALKQLAENPDAEIGEGKVSDEAELRGKIRDIIKKNPKAKDAPRPEQAYMGLVMKELRGKADGKMVMKILKEELK